MAQLMDSRFLLTDASNTPQNGAKLRIYDAGTTNLTSVFSDAALSVPLTNPVVASSSGILPQVFAAEGTVVDLQWLTSADVSIPGRSYEDVTFVGGDSGVFSRTLPSDSRVKITGSAGAVLVQAGSPSPDDVGGELVLEGWEGTQMDTLTIDAAAVTFTGTSGLGAGKHAIWVPASAMTTRTTNGAASGLSETTTNKVMYRTFDFDPSTIEYVQFSIRMPKSWNEGTVTFVPEWSHGSTTVNFGVSWGLQAVSLSNDDALDTAFGTAQYSIDTGGTTDDLYAGPESSAITIGGTPAAEDFVVFQVLRNATDGTNDTLAVDARLHGITLFVTTNALSDE